MTNILSGMVDFNKYVAGPFNINNSLAINLLVAGINLAIATQKILRLDNKLICDGLVNQKELCQYKTRGAITIAVFAGTVAAALVVSNFVYSFVETKPTGCCHAFLHGERLKTKERSLRDKFITLRVFSMLSLIGSGMVLFLISAFSDDLKVDPTFYAALATSLIESSRNYFEAKGVPETVAGGVNGTALTIDDAELKSLLTKDPAVITARAKLLTDFSAKVVANVDSNNANDWDGYHTTFSTSFKTALNAAVKAKLTQHIKEANATLSNTRSSIQLGVEGKAAAIVAANAADRAKEEAKLFAAYEELLYERLTAERQLNANFAQIV